MLSICSFVSACDSSMDADVLFLVDDSGSMSGTFPSAMDFIKHFSSMFRIGPSDTQFGLIVYYNTGGFYLNAYSTSVDLVNGIPGSK